MAAVSSKAERDVARFDEGELWCADDASPALSPAGWYFRPRRSGAAPWIGPFEDAAAASGAAFSGDALRDARVQLDRWRRRDAAPPVRIVWRRPAPLPAMNAAGQFELTVEGAATPPAPSGRGRRRRAARAPQYALPLAP
ncbi:MAG: hypothetical protein Q7J32_10020 [Sphingomonadaceae bacterium]|nr:hypothetical protein [Sphingomonadaceae bacterium]